MFTCGILFGVFPFVFFTSQDTEIAVLYSTIFAEFEPTTVDTGGFHTKPYAAKVILWPRVETNIEFDDILCNSRDGLLIDTVISFQYIPDPTELIDLSRQFGSHGAWEQLMRVQAESAIRDTCGDFVADDYQNNRGAVAASMEDQVRNRTSTLFKAIVTKLQLKNVNRPVAFETAVRDKENARSQIGLARNEEAQALTQAETKKDVAVEEATRILDSANTTAEIKLAQAEAESEAILDRFTQLGSVFGAVKQSSQLTNKGILTYISNEIFHQDITIGVEAPVELDFKQEL